MNKLTALGILRKALPILRCRYGRTGKPVWLDWSGDTMPPLCEMWQLYCHRFGVDHWFRFAKQRLHWTLPNLSTAKQAERWSDLMPLLSWQLWLARELVADFPCLGRNRRPGSPPDELINP